MDKDHLIGDDKWDFYSGLPNPSWYENDKFSDSTEDED